MAAVVTANELNYVMKQALLDQTMDAIIVPGKKWFSLQDNKLDGTYYPVDSSSVLQVGWWGATCSIAGGVLSPNPILTITESRPIHTLQVIGDNLLGEYPVDFVIKLYSGASVLYTETVTGNASVTWKKNLTQVYDVTKIDITVSKINKVGRTVKLISSFSPFEIARTDVLLPKILDVSQVSASINSVDTLTPKIVDVTTSITNNVFSTDILTPKILDTSFFIQYEIWRSDILTPKVLDTSFFTQYEIWRSDNLLPKIVDISTPIQNTFSSSDILTPKIVEAKAIQVNLISNDLIIISETLEVDDLVADIYSGDTILVSLTDTMEMNNVYVAMDADTRQIYGKLEVTYTDPFSDESIVVIANETGKDTYPEQVADNITEPKYKWFSLQDNTLDGSYHPLPADKKYSVGWWSNSLSDATGSFSIYPTVTVLFDARSLLTLKVVGDSLLNVYPVDFTVTAYNALDAVLHTENIVGNTEVNWNKIITPILGVTKLELKISKINKPYSSAKIMEFYTAVVETYMEETIESFNVLEEIGYTSGNLPIGNMSANEIDIALDNSDNRFDITNNQSTLYGLLKKNRRIKAFLGVEIIPGEIEWHPFGVFWTTSWNVPKNAMVAYATARDRLELLRFTDFTISRLYTNWTLYDLFELILIDAELTEEDYVIDTALHDIVLPYAWFDRVSHREALQELTKCTLVQIFCDKNGKIIITYNIQPTSDVMYVFDEDKNIFETKQPLAWADVVNYVEVISKTYSESDVSSLCKDATLFTVPASTSIDMVYTFSTTPVISISSNNLVADAGISVTHIENYAWGAIVTFTNGTLVDKNVTSIEIFGTTLKEIGKNVQLAKDDIAIRDDGKIKVTIEHKFIQDSNYALLLATDILNTYKNSRYDVVLDNRGCIALRLGDNTRLKDTNENTADSYMVSRQNVQWNGVLSAITEGKKY